MAFGPYLRRAGSYAVLAAIGVVPALVLTAVIEFAFFSRMSELMSHSALDPTAVLSGGLGLVGASMGGLQVLGFGIAYALIARAIQAQRAGREPSIGSVVRGLESAAGPLAAVLLISAVFIGAIYMVEPAVAPIAKLFMSLAPVAVAVDGGTALTAFRRGVNAAFRAPASTVLVVGLAELAVIMLNLMRLAFSLTAAQFGHFSFGVQGAAAVISSVIAACAGVALAAIYRNTPVPQARPGSPNPTIP